jgi:hypothetical protein
MAQKLCFELELDEQTKESRLQQGLTVNSKIIRSVEVGAALIADVAERAKAQFGVVPSPRLRKRFLSSC